MLNKWIIHHTLRKIVQIGSNSFQACCEYKQTKISNLYQKIKEEDFYYYTAYDLFFIMISNHISYIFISTYKDVMNKKLKMTMVWMTVDQNAECISDEFR